MGEPSPPCRDPTTGPAPLTMPIPRTDRAAISARSKPLGVHHRRGGHAPTTLSQTPKTSCAGGRPLLRPEGPTARGRSGPAGAGGPEGSRREDDQGGSQVDVPDDSCLSATRVRIHERTLANCFSSASRSSSVRASHHAAGRRAWGGASVPADRMQRARLRKSAGRCGSAILSAFSA